MASDGLLRARSIARRRPARRHQARRGDDPLAMTALDRLVTGMESPKSSTVTIRRRRTWSAARRARESPAMHTLTGSPRCAQGSPLDAVTARMTTTLTWSPMLEQYFGMKHRYPEAILLSRVGDFYEAYGEDAETIGARALDRPHLERSRRRAPGRNGRRAVPCARRIPVQADRATARWSRWPSNSSAVPNKLVRRDVVASSRPARCSKSIFWSARPTITWRADHRVRRRDRAGARRHLDRPRRGDRVRR